MTRLDLAAFNYSYIKLYKKKNQTDFVGTLINLASFGCWFTQTLV